MKIFFQCVELVNEYQRKHKEKLRKEVHERYQNLSEEEKERKPQYFQERNMNLSEEEKEKNAEYEKRYYLAHKK